MTKIWSTLSMHSLWSRTPRAVPLIAAVVTVLGVGVGSTAMVQQSSGTHGGPTAASDVAAQPSPSTAAKVPPASVSATPSAAALPGVAAQHAATSSEPAATSTDPSNLDPCSAPGGGSFQPSTEQEVVDHIVGTWLVCSHPTTFGTDEVGLRVDSNGHWSKLYRNSDGQLVASSGDRDEGTWQVLDDSAMNGQPTFQVNFEISAIGGTVITIPEWANAVTRMHLDNNGVYVADYVPTSEPVLPAPSVTPPPTPPELGPCSAPANGSANPVTAQEMAQRIVGTWLICSHPSIFGTGEVGMLIESNGQWAKLYRNAAGDLVASSAAEEHGTWLVSDVSAMNGRPTYQVTFVLAPSGNSVPTLPVFAKAVTRIHLDNNGVYSANYVPTTEPVSAS